MDDAIADVPETEIDNEIADTVEAHVEVEPSGETDIDVTIAPPDEPVLSEVEPESPLPSDAEIEVTSGVTDSAEEPVIVASDVTPNTETTKEVTTEVKRTPDARPKRRLGWRAFILGGSGGTK